MFSDLFLIVFRGLFSFFLIALIMEFDHLLAHLYIHSQQTIIIRFTIELKIDIIVLFPRSGCELALNVHVGVLPFR